MHLVRIGKVKHELRVQSTSCEFKSSVRTLKARAARLKARVRRIKARFEAMKPRIR